MDEIVNRLQSEYHRAGLSYPELEKRTGVSKSQIQRYITGFTSRVPADTLMKLADVFEVPVMYLMGLAPRDFKPEIDSNRGINCPLWDRLSKQRLMHPLLDLIKDATDDDIQRFINVMRAIRQPSDTNTDPE